MKHVFLLIRISSFLIAGSIWFNRLFLVSTASYKPNRHPKIQPLSLQIKTYCDPLRLFLNDCDYRIFETYISAEGFRESYCNKNNYIVAGGVNEGQLASHILRICPDVSFVGTEIQLGALVIAKTLLANFTHAYIYHGGWSDHRTTMKISTNAEGRNQGAGLFTTEGRKASYIGRLSSSAYEVPVFTLEEFAFQHRIERALVVVIDTEGYEPIVIKGMHLEKDENRRLFSFIHFELGGTWAERDLRHPPGSMTQYETALYLESLGYEILIIGCGGFLPVEPEFFNHVEDFTTLFERRNEGRGYFVQGNALAIYRRFANELLLKTVDSHIWVSK
jgi:FkbM family methyltransferase